MGKVVCTAAAGQRNDPRCTSPVRCLQFYMLEPDCQLKQGGAAGPVKRNEGMDDYGRAQARR